MSTRVSFYIFTTNKISDDATLDRDVEISDLTIRRDGNLLTKPQLQNNGDGTYFFTPSGSGEYSVYLAGESIPEYSNIYITDDDSLKHAYVDGTSLAISGSTLILSGSVLYTGSVISGWSGSTTEVLSANQGVIINDLLNNLEDVDTTILKEANIENSFSASTDDTKIQSAESLEIDFSDLSYISEETSYIAGLRVLDSQVSKMEAGVTSSLYRSYHFFGYSGSFLLNGNDNSLFLKVVDSDIDNSVTGSYRVLRNGMITGFSFQAYIEQSDTSDAYTNFRISKNSSAAMNYIGELNYGSTSGSVGKVFSKSIPISQSDYFSVRMDSSEKDGDDLRIGNFAIMVEITY